MVFTERRYRTLEVLSATGESSVEPTSRTTGDEQWRV